MRAVFLAKINAILLARLPAPQGTIGFLAR
jgi:hypothetical protein